MTAATGSETYIPPAVESRYPAPRVRIAGGPDTPWLRRALPVVRAHWLMLGTSLTFSFLSLIIQVRIPDVIRNAVDQSLVARSRPVGGFVTTIAVLAAAKWVTTFIGRLYLLKSAYRIEYDLRNMLFAHLARLSPAFYDRTQSGMIISRANSDIRAVQRYLAFGPNIVVQCAVVGIAFWQMLTINVPLAFLSMAAMPVVYVTGMRLRLRVMPASWLGQVRLAEVAGAVAENVSGIRVVKAFAAEERQVRDLDLRAKRARWAQIAEADIRARFSPIVENVARLGSAVILLAGGWMVIDGRTSIGTIIAFNAYVLIIQPPFRQLGLLLMMGRRAATSAGRIFELMDTRSDIVERPDAVDLLDCHGKVDLTHVSFGYRDGPQVLRDLTLSLRPGETVALVGRTGSGKSTVARLLTRMYDVTGGEVRVDDRDVRGLTLASVRHNVGLMTDEPFLFSATIRENIAYGRPDASLADVVAAARAAQADEFIDRLEHGYDTAIGERGYDLSGGQRQRIAMARALLMNSRVLILDDATSAVDVAVEERIHHALRSVLSRRTTIVISHRLSTIRLADRVIVIDDGRVAADGEHDTLLATEPVYREILDQQLTGEDQRLTGEPGAHPSGVVR